MSASVRISRRAAVLLYESLDRLIRGSNPLYVSSEMRGVHSDLKKALQPQRAAEVSK